MSEQIKGYEPGGEDAVALYLDLVRTRESDLNVAAITADDTALEAIEREIEQELTEVNPLNGRQVWISGNALRAHASRHDQNITVATQDDPASSVSILEPDSQVKLPYGRLEALKGMYHRPYIQVFKGEYGLEYRIRHGIIIGYETQELDEGTRIVTSVSQALFESDSVIQLCDEIETILCPPQDISEASSPEVIQAVNRYSSNLVHLLNAEEFLRLSAAEQTRSLDDLIKHAEQESQIWGRYTIVEFSSLRQPSRHIYVPTTSGNQFRLRRRRDIPEILTGDCVGLESLAFLALRKCAIRTTNGLRTSRSGLSLVIHPDGKTAAALGIDGNSVIYIPTSSQNFDVIFEDRPVA